MTERMLIATTPTAVTAAHDDAAKWARLKMHEVRLELAVERENLKSAERAKWATKPFKRNIAKLEARVTFYEKMVSAVDAGYHIVPNFYMSVFAIRTDAKRPIQKQRVQRNWVANHFPQRPKALPAGDGRYVSPQASYIHWKEFRTDNDGKDYQVNVSRSADLEMPDFPMCMATPEILAVTERAQALAIFDEIGIARDQDPGCGDPMILGRIRQKYSRPSLTFFIAWSLPLEKL